MWVINQLSYLGERVAAFLDRLHGRSLSKRLRSTELTIFVLAVLHQNPDKLPCWRLKVEKVDNGMALPKTIRDVVTSKKKGAKHSYVTQALRGNVYHDFQTLSGWWFVTFLMFPYIGNNHPNWLILFRGVGIPPTSNGMSTLDCYAPKPHGARSSVVGATPRSSGWKRSARNSGLRARRHVPKPGGLGKHVGNFMGI